MISLKARIEKFAEQGEKTGWTFVTIPAQEAQKLKPGFKKSFRVKGTIDQFAVRQTALIPIGEGDYILPLNQTIRKAIGKSKGHEVQLRLAADDSAFEMNADLVACLEDDALAQANFKKLSGSEQKYFSKWVDSAKTDATKSKRIVQTLHAMHQGFHYGQMIRSLKKTE
ncbi:MAG: DUF1905 domain-containing protein [Bacteroidetes bacterium]|nr:DUF1905 domain-containing protein [Bacteroidota bacterium]